MKKEFPDNWNLLDKELAYPCEYFQKVEDYELDICNNSKEDFFSKLNNDHFDAEEIK